MKKVKAIRYICLGGILAAITVILQSAPVYLPVIGLVLSPLSTLPIAMATVINAYLGIMVLISSSLILIIVSIQEALILLFATGLIGLILGGLIHRRGYLASILAALVSLMIGLMILTYIVAIPGFRDFTSSLSLFTIILIYFIFSFFYISIWAIYIRRFTGRFLYAILKL